MSIFSRLFLVLFIFYNSALAADEYKFVVAEAAPRVHSLYRHENHNDGFGGYAWYTLTIPYEITFTDFSTMYLPVIWVEETNYWGGDPPSKSLQNIPHSFLIEPGDELILSDKITYIPGREEVFEVKLFRDGTLIHKIKGYFSQTRFPWQ